MSSSLKVIAFIALLVASGAAAVAAAMASKVGFIASTISNNERLNADFGAAALLIDDFIGKNHYLPPETEFRGTKYPFDVESNRAQFPQEALNYFGPPPAAGREPYLLIARGYDVPKVWASWTRTSTAFTNPAHFYVLGSSSADTLLFGAGASLLLLSAAVLARGGLTIRSSGPL
jgi:hypothetical protein